MKPSPLDLDAIQARCDATKIFRKHPTKRPNRLAAKVALSYLDVSSDDLDACIAEIRRLRELVDSIHAKYQDGKWFLPYFYDDDQEDEMLSVQHWKLKRRQAAGKLREKR